MSIFGKTTGFKASVLKRLEKIGHRRVSPDEFVSTELASELSELCRETGRMLGIFINRRGHIEEVIVGDPTRLYLPDIGRLRASSGRLRGLRLVVARAKSAKDTSVTAADYSINADFVGDLEKLQLDAIVQLESLLDGTVGRVAVGSLLPLSRGRRVSRVSHIIDRYRDIHQLQTSFTDFIQDLESQLQASVDEAMKSAKADTDRDAAVLIGVYTTPRKEWAPSLQELKELAKTAGVHVVDTVVQQRQSLDAKTIVGAGKIEEICLLALQKGAEALIFDCELSPSQLNAITDLTDLKVLDRTMLILDIFARRATSQEGMLQVELAQLKYSLPRLAKKQTGLSRLTGGIGGQGPGETKLEIDRRRAKDKVARIEAQIEKLRMQRQLRRKNRNERNLPVISIVGYTNAGKSTLLNALTGSSVYVENKLFATLDPTSRRLRFPKEREVIITDTVGFIRDLPENLVNAFKATLEELHDADLLVHVVDATDPYQDRQIKSVEKVLEDLGLLQTKRLIVFNKADALPEGLAQKRARLHKGLAVSALSKQGLKEMLVRCESMI